MQRIDGSNTRLSRTLARAGAVLLLATGWVTPLLAQDQPVGPVPVRVRHVEGAVTVQRASAGETSSAIVNLPLDAGDRIWTEGDGRAELTLGDGTTVWLDERTTIDIVALTEERAGSNILRLWGGSVLVWRPSSTDLPSLRFDSADTVVSLADPGLSRVDIDDERRLWLSVFDGRASMAAGGLVETLAAGQQTYTEPGTAPARAIAFSTADVDAFGRWQQGRWSSDAATTRYVVQREYVPREVRPYAAELEAAGSWFYHDDFGTYAWRPTVAVGWSPYRHGRWVWGYGGWTWASSARWGWATAHYGRWHHLPHRGWVWFPGGGYRPASVSWYVGYGYVGWSPIGYYGRPFISINLWFGGGHGYGHGYHGRHNYQYPSQAGYGGRAVAGRGYARGGTASPAGWTLVAAGDLGRGESTRRAVSRAVLPAGAAQNAASLNGALRQRNVSALGAGRQVPARSAGTSRGAPTGRGVATPRGGTRAGEAARPAVPSRNGAGRPAIRPGQTTGKETPTRDIAGTSGVRPRPGTTGGGRSATTTVRPRPGGLSGGLSPTRGTIRRPGGRPTGGSVANPRPVAPSGRPSVGRPSGGTSRPTITPRPVPTRSGVGPRPGGASAPRVVPRGASTPGRPSIIRSPGRPSVSAPRGTSSRGSVSRGKAAPRGRSSSSGRTSSRRSGARRR